MFMNVKESLFEKLEAKKEEMVQHRRYLHQHPELSFSRNGNRCLYSRFLQK